jgi:4-amino-4-deoxy-L-arabinose transferase-like glycosyltransferase
MINLTKTKALAAILLLWGAIYLPNLGSEELIGTEDIRVPVAAEMLDDGDYIMPHFGGEEYYNKPPGYQWLIAGSFVLTGQRTELAARLPSVVFMLAAAAMIILMPGSWPELPGRTLAAVALLCGVGLTNAGRRAQIEAPYVCLTAMALIWWLCTYAADRSRWLVWIPTALFLAFGALLKGPIHGVVFYAMVVCVLAYQRRLRELLSPAHLAGVAVILFICLGWVFWAYHRSNAGGQMLGTWLTQWVVRVHPDQEHATPWVRNVSLAFVDWMPWMLLMPALWLRPVTSLVPPERVPFFKGMRLALVICFVAINAMPATLARYSLPVYPLGCLVLGYVLSLHHGLLPTDKIWRIVLEVAALGCAGLAVAGLIVFSTAPEAWLALAAALAVAVALAWKARKLQGGLALGLATSAVMAVGVLQYSAFRTPFQPEKLRPVARQLNAALPQGQELCVYQPRRQALMFYLRPPKRYLLTPEQITPSVNYLIIRTDLLDTPDIAARLAGRSPKTIATYQDYRKRDCLLLEIAPVAGSQ